LQVRLADGIDLALVTKQAHWNLKGPQFIGVHLMLDGFRDEQDNWNDMMAERITQLRGTVQEVGRETKLSPYTTDLYAIADHVKALIERYAARGGRLRRDTVSLWISGASADCYGVVPLAGRCAGRA
jgi:starvation-inducible DNA-binding protein